MAVPALKLTLNATGSAPPPKDIGPAGKDYWQRVCSARSLDAEALVLLAAMCKFLDRAAEAAKAVKSEGAFQTSKQGTIYPHPGIAVERASLQSFERCRRSLNLDSVPADVAITPLKRAAYR